MKKSIELAVAATFLVFSSIASANIMYTWNADGMTENTSQQATAIFDFTDASSFTITLMNNVDPTESILSELDGILFSFSEAPATLTLTSVSPFGVIDCTSSSTAPCAPGSGSNPYGWGATNNAGAITLGAGYSDSTGDFAYHPYGIVNQKYNPGQLGDPAYNPLLTGPVKFAFQMTWNDNILPSVPEVTSATFLFGKAPDEIRGIPEPNSLALIGAGLLALVAFSTRRKHVISPRA